MLVLVLAALLQATVPVPGSSQPDVIVRGERDRQDRARRIDRQVDQILPQTVSDQPLARFQDAICPGVTGLSPASAQAVADRIGIVADRLGLSVAESGCQPNLLVVVTADAEATTRTLIARRPGLFPGQNLAEIRRIRAEKGGARGWTTVEVRSRDGERPIVDNTGPPILQTATAGRLGLGFRRDILSAVVMIDAAAARGRATDQIADYAIMRGLADARPERLRHGDTVLTAFNAEGDAAAPAGLTDLDWGILRGLYAGRGNRPSTLVRGEIVRRVMTPIGEQP